MSRICLDASGNPVQAIYPGVNQSVAFNGTSAQSSAVRSRIVRVVATADCFISIGADPTASSSTTFLPSTAIEYLAVHPSHKIAVIQSSSAGTLYITEAD